MMQVVVDFVNMADDSDKVPSRTFVRIMLTDDNTYYYGTVPSGRRQQCDMSVDVLKQPLLQITQQGSVCAATKTMKAAGRTVQPQMTPRGASTW